MSDAPTTNDDKAVERVDYRSKTFEEIAVRLFDRDDMKVRMFARWLDEHGYKTFPDMPDYIS